VTRLLARRRPTLLRKLDDAVAAEINSPTLFPESVRPFLPSNREEILQHAVEVMRRADADFNPDRQALAFALGWMPRFKVAQDVSMKFDQQQISHVFVGSFAAFAYGSARLAGDLDIHVDRANMRKAFVAMGELGFTSEAGGPASIVRSFKSQKQEYQVFGPRGQTVPFEVQVIDATDFGIDVGRELAGGNRRFSLPLPRLEMVAAERTHQLIHPRGGKAQADKQMLWDVIGFTQMRRDQAEAVQKALEYTPNIRQAFELEWEEREAKHRVPAQG
jgi:hypothetical protein